jgi:hypothetical protein
VKHARFVATFFFELRARSGFVPSRLVYRRAALQDGFAPRPAGLPSAAGQDD